MLILFLADSPGTPISIAKRFDLANGGSNVFSSHKTAKVPARIRPDCPAKRTSRSQSICHVAVGRPGDLARRTAPADRPTLIRIISGSHRRKAEHFAATAFGAVRLLHAIKVSLGFVPTSDRAASARRALAVFQ